MTDTVHTHTCIPMQYVVVYVCVRASVCVSVCVCGRNSNFLTQHSRHVLRIYVKYVCGVCEGCIFCVHHCHYALLQMLPTVSIALNVKKTQSKGRERNMRREKRSESMNA